MPLKEEKKNFKSIIQEKEYENAKKRLKIFAEERFGTYKENPDDLLEHDNFEIKCDNFDIKFEINYKNENLLKCPHCELNAMEYKKLEHNIEGQFSDTTHVWVCRECPDITFEYVHPEDIKRLSTYLEEGTVK